MADENDVTEQQEGQDQQAGGRRLWVWIVVAVVLVALVVGAVLWWLGREPQTAEADTETPATETQAQALYFSLDPPIVVNFRSQGRVRYLQAAVAVMTRDPAVLAGVEQHLPLVRNELVLMFGGEVFEELQTEDGREQLRQKAREAIDRILRREIGKAGIEQVLFTSFVMQ